MKEKPVRKRSAVLEVIAAAEILAIFLIWYLVFRDAGHALYACVLTYYPLAWTLRLTLQRHHREGMKKIGAGQLEEALVCFRKSEDFFTRHAWVDRFRVIMMFSGSEYGYREMALQNQAHTLLRLNRAEEAKAPLERLATLNPSREEIGQLLGQIRAQEAQKAEHTS